jgi:uncharacterized membrane protein
MLGQTEYQVAKLMQLPLSLIAILDWLATSGHSKLVAAYPQLVVAYIQQEAVKANVEIHLCVPD